MTIWVRINICIKMNPNNFVFKISINIGRGRLAQRETIRLLIQRSKFDYRLRQMIFLLRVAKMRDTDLFEFLFSEKAKAPSTGKESGLSFFL